jgi:tetrahydromethanopterin S-methyltransferase subunit G
MSEDLTRGLPNDVTEQILTLLRGVDARLTRLEERVDRRLMETRPIWEQVLSRLDVIDTRLQAVEVRLGSVEAELGTVKTRLDHVDTRLEVVDTRLDGLDQRIDTLGLDMRAGFKRLERQMAQLAQEGTFHGLTKAIWRSAWTGLKTNSSPSGPDDSACDLESFLNELRIRRVCVSACTLPSASSHPLAWPQLSR